VNLQLQCLPDGINKLNPLQPITILSRRVAAIVALHAPDLLLERVLVRDRDAARIRAARRFLRRRRRVLGYGRRGRLCRRLVSCCVGRHCGCCQAASDVAECSEKLPQEGHWKGPGSLLQGAVVP
jgi:hypothetical protein